MDKIIIIKADIENYNDFYQLRCEKKNIYWSGHTDKPNYNNFKNWYNDNKEKIYLAYIGNKAIGYIYLYTKKDSIELSIGISEEKEGKGYASFLIGYFINLIENTKLIIEANIFESNIASQKVFLKNGFIKTDEFIKKKICNKTERQFKYIYKYK